jgi:peptide/nickel transport system ATP-binding protein
MDPRAAPLLEVRGLGVGFTDRSGRTREVLREVDLTVQAGQTLGLVGESGSGKSTLALAAMAYLKPGLRRTAGSVRLEGQDLFALPDSALQRLRGGVIGLVPQNAGQALTPTSRVGRQVEESLRLHTALGPDARRARVLELLEQVRLPEPAVLARRYPHELSGGQQQRVAIAMALAGSPRLLLLDEPTTGLDVTTQAHVLELLRDIGRQTGTAMVYVSHDLGAIARVCERVNVLYAGEVVLEGPVREVLRRPAHPYPQGLLASIPRLAKAALPQALPGRPPAPGDGGAGCAFAPRCALAQDRCREERPVLRPLGEAGASRCHLAEQAVTLSLRPLDGAHAAAAVAVPTQASAAVLQLEGLGLRYARPTLLDQVLGREPAAPLTVDDVHLEVDRGETVALVGESGSGKSSILKAVAGLLLPVRGHMRFGDGEELPGGTDRRSPAQLRRVQLIFQNPDDSLNPRHTVATLLAQPLQLYFGLRGEALRERSVQWLERVRLGAHYLDRLPGQMSGGEKQRVAIARAFAAEPDLVLCDEVTSALDVSVQAAVLELLQTLERERGTATLVVSHDLAVVRALADRVAVLYQGRLCEVGPAAAVYAAPSHPYTEVLLGAVLEPDPDHVPTLLAHDITESAPPARGCPFQRRCPKRLGAVCDEQAPPWQSTATPGHRIRCHIPAAALAAAAHPTDSALAAAARHTASARAAPVRPVPETPGA